MPETVDIAVAALVRAGRILLVHRNPHRQAYPDCWDLVGGHVEPGESPLRAVVRECGEEIGVRIHRPLPMRLAYADPALTVHAYVAHDWDGEPFNAAPDEHDDLAWFTADELSALTLADAGSLPVLAALARASQHS